MDGKLDASLMRQACTLRRLQNHENEVRMLVQWVCGNNGLADMSRPFAAARMCIAIARVKSLVDLDCTPLRPAGMSRIEAAVATTSSGQCMAPGQHSVV